MTVQDSDIRRDFTGNGSTTEFDYNGTVYNTSHFDVILVDEDGVESSQVLNTDFTATIESDFSGGAVTMNTAPAVGERLVIFVNVPSTQLDDLQNYDGTPADVFERAMDYAALRDARQDEANNRTVKLSEGSTQSDIKIENLTANRVLTVSADGTKIIMGETASGAGADGDMEASTYDPAGLEEQLVGLIAEQELSNKTLEAAILNGAVSGTSILDADDFSGASSTTLSSSESIKAYVDAQVGGVSVGETNTASNVGSGSGIYKEKSSSDLVFKSLVAGTNVTFDVSANEIEINASGGGGGGGGSFSDLDEVTESTVTRNGDTAVNKIAHGLDAGDMLLLDQPSTDGHEYSHTLFVKRTADYDNAASGPAPNAGWVNGAIYAVTTVESTARTNEWCIVGVMNNYAPVGSGGGAGGENCGAYFQGNHYSAGFTWGIAIEVNDYDAGSGKSGNLWGSECLIRTDRTHSGNDLICSTYFTRGMDDSTSAGKIYAYGLCDSAWYGADIGHAVPAALETHATNGWVVGDYASRVAGGAGGVPVDNAFVAFNDGSSAFLDKAGGSKAVGFAANATYSNCAFRQKQGDKFGWDINGVIVTSFDGSTIWSNRGIEVRDVVSSGAYFSASGGAPKYGIDFGSKSFPTGYVLRSGPIDLQNDGVINFKGAQSGNDIIVKVQGMARKIVTVAA